MAANLALESEANLDKVLSILGEASSLNMIRFS